MPLVRFTPNVNKSGTSQGIDGTSEGEIHSRTGHEGPKGKQTYSSLLSLISALDEVRGQRQAPADLPPGERPGAHRKGGWVGPRAGLDGSG